jgi:ribosomal protein S18 acetylase RimI-like enzyme
MAGRTPRRAAVRAAAETISIERVDDHRVPYPLTVSYEHTAPLRIGRNSVDLSRLSGHPAGMLPEGFSWRPAGSADAEDILSLLTQTEISSIGFVDSTLDQIRDHLAEPDFTLETDTFLVHAPDGLLAGFGWAQRWGTGERVDTDVISPDDRVLNWLYPRVLARAKEMARAGGHPDSAVYLGIHRGNDRGRAAAQAHGFASATAFHRMRIDHGPVPPRPVAPPGVWLRTGPGDEYFRRIAKDVLDESFKDHFGWVPETFEQWHERLERESTFDWSQLAVAELDSRPVAMLLTGDRFIESENCGYVCDIGVLAEARGRGIAKFLLRTAFAADMRAGRAGTILYVDTNNTTPAFGLYESVGMRPVLVVDMLRYSGG